MTHAWIDASAGVAGDMLLGALLDADADPVAVQAAVDAVIGGAVTITQTEVTRAGLRAGRVQVTVAADHQPHRTWRQIRELIDGSGLPRSVSGPAAAVFARLAEAEGRVHGVPADEVRFHEVGALDSIADIVGVCAALHDLDVGSITAGEIALGSGRVRVAHGEMPVPVPAVAELAQGWRVNGLGDGEATTPTGMALITTLASRCEELPSMLVTRIGIGAGGRDPAGRANVTRVVLGELRPAEGRPTSEAWLLEANVDDLDPRLWPGVLTELLRSGADDAWLVPVLMKKGRPAHILSVLCQADRADRLRHVMLATTSTIGVRQTRSDKYALPRTWFDVDVHDRPIAIKVAHEDGIIRQVTPEFDSIAAAAEEAGIPQGQLLSDAATAAAAAGLVVGAPLPSPPARDRNQASRWG